tara:strand:+ start:1070 stop:1402 length:333 start_codon:yes stop_codon:yes gene_type:complete
MAFGLVAFAEAPFSAVGGTFVPVTGVVATTSLGAESVDAEANVSPVNVVGTMAVGSAAIDAEANVFVTGVSATFETNTFTLVWSNIDTSQTANYSSVNTSQTPDYKDIAA